MTSVLQSGESNAKLTNNLWPELVAHRATCSALHAVQAEAGQTLRACLIQAQVSAAVSCASRRRQVELPWLQPAAVRGAYS
jgi:hypothetical protein